MSISLFDKSLPRKWHKGLLVLLGICGFIMSVPILSILPDEPELISETMPRIIVVGVSVWVFISSPILIGLGIFGFLRQCWIERHKKEDIA